MLSSSNSLKNITYTHKFSTAYLFGMPSLRLTRVQIQNRLYVNIIFTENPNLWKSSNLDLTKIAGRETPPIQMSAFQSIIIKTNSSLHIFYFTSIHGGLLHKFHDSTSLGLNPLGAKKILVIIQILREELSLIMFKNYMKKCNFYYLLYQFFGCYCACSVIWSEYT